MEDGQINEWREFFKAAGLTKDDQGKYAQSFSENDVEVQCFCEMLFQDTESSIHFMKSLGVKPAGHQMKISMEAKKSRRPPQICSDIRTEQVETTQANIKIEIETNFQPGIKIENTKELIETTTNNNVTTLPSLASSSNQFPPESVLNPFFVDQYSTIPPASTTSKENISVQHVTGPDNSLAQLQPLRTAKRPRTKSAPLISKQQTAISAALAAGVPAGQQKSVSCVMDTSTQREDLVECFAPHVDHRWTNIGKKGEGMAPNAVQYARALRPPSHLLSFLRIKGHSIKGRSSTNKNIMVFVVLEGDITVILHNTQFTAKKGDSFYIPPKNHYNLINQKARKSELSLIQFQQYDGPLP